MIRIRILIITVMVVLFMESVADDYHGWEYVKTDTMIPHDLESYPLHLKTVSKIKDGDSISVLIDQKYDIVLTLSFMPLHVRIFMFNSHLCASMNGDHYLDTTLGGDFITNTTENIWSIRKTNISLDLDVNSITLLQYNFSKIEQECISLRSINVLWIYLTSSEKSFPWIPTTVVGLQYKPHIRDYSDCQVKEVGNPPYLKLACKYDNTTWFRCPFTHNYYTVGDKSDSGCVSTDFDSACPRDTHFYQACGHSDCTGYQVLEHSTLFCSTYVCDIRNRSSVYQQPQAGKFYEATFSCNGKYDCLNTKVDEQLDCRFDEEDQYQCKDNSSLRTRKKLAASKTCDNKCNCFDCDDEAHCNGFHYGVECELKDEGSWGNYDGGSYAAPANICDGYEHCTDGSDEKNCSQSNKTCHDGWQGDVRYLKDNQICAVPRGLGVCGDGKDQVNCPDPHKIAMSCLLAGSPTNISIFAVCKDYPLCDDDYNNNCLEPEGGCSVHKSFLCDGIADCPGGSDESEVYCSHMSSFNCTRRVARFEAKGNKIIHPFPLSWVNDNEIDCMDGKDEDDIYWNVCEFGSIELFIEKESRCMDVKKCREQEEGFISVKNLCDRVESCGGENDLCGVSRGIQTTWNTLIEQKAADTKVVSYCLKGLMNLQRSASFCLVRGVPSPNAGDTAQFVRKGGKLNLPNSKFDCRFVYGEMYVYLACSNSCLASSTPCPLRTIPSDTCVNKMKERVFTVTDSNNLTVSLRKLREYHNEIYPCDNKNCVLYNKVCNLVDDCGDVSDEVNCTNHFYCPGYKEYIPLTSKCDGQVDCRDFYDECNHDCVTTQRVVRSSKNTSRNDTTQHTRDIQLKISAIIFTDFMCWIPLTVVCFLHYGDIINATKWYPYFSIALLPINSVINPLLYNGDLVKMLIGPVRVLNRYRQETKARWTTR
ncbi:low-density lipoprotein receptor-related protein 1B-like [Bolinopsis microptera]|uniref:low-density lipoprotein receptor-related protein 1B-like n=1 Tax=Bolinopsis microptera TaxID=2820187 RepID=UPI00307A0EBE